MNRLKTYKSDSKPSNRQEFLGITRREYVIIFISVVLLSVVLIQIRFVKNRSTHKPDNPKYISKNISKKDSSNSVAISNNDTNSVSSPNSTSKPVTSSNTPTNTDVQDAKLCQSTINNAKALGDSYSRQYYSAWSTWNTQYYGAYDSQAAIDSKNSFKGITQKQYSDLISSTDPTMQSLCHSTTSLRDILLIPNYDAWQ